MQAGDVAHNLHVLAATRGLVGIHCNSDETSLSQIVNTFGRRAVIVIDQSASLYDNPLSATPEESMRRCLETFRQAGAPGAVIVGSAGLSRLEALELASFTADAAYTMRAVA